MKAKRPKLSSSAKNFMSHRLFITSISILFILVMVVNMIGLLIAGQAKYFSTNYWKRYPELKKTYYNSVYANKKGNFPRDEILYAFNGGALITGTNPILVNPEVPPTGKYLVGLSILIFGNEHMGTFIFGIVALCLMFLVGMQIFKSVPLALISPTAITFETFFKNQFVYTPLFDIFQLVFLLAAFYFFNRGFMARRRSMLWFTLSSICLGLFISTKFFGSGVPVVAACLIVLFLNKQFKKMFFYFATLPIAACILLLSYVRVLIIGYPFLKFLGIQKWILWYNQGHLHNRLSVWPLLLANYWIQGAGKISHDPQWSITWPLSTLIAGIVTVEMAINRQIANKNLEVLVVWSVMYLALLSFSDASARYFVILLPILFMICTWGIYRFACYLFTKI